MNSYSESVRNSSTFKGQEEEEEGITKIEPELWWILKRGFCEPTPLGWTTGMGNNGKTYYINKENGKTSDCHPKDQYYKNMYMTELKKIEQKRNEKENKSSSSNTLSQDKNRNELKQTPKTNRAQNENIHSASNIEMESPFKNAKSEAKTYGNNQVTRNNSSKKQEENTLNLKKNKTSSEQSDQENYNENNNNNQETKEFNTIKDKSFKDSNNKNSENLKNCSTIDTRRNSPDFLANQKLLKESKENTLEKDEVTKDFVKSESTNKNKDLFQEKDINKKKL